MIERPTQHKILSYIVQMFLYRPDLTELTTNLRYLTDLHGTEAGRMKLSQIMGCLVELRELCEKSQNEQENIRL